MPTPSYLRTVEIECPPIYYRAERVHVAAERGKLEVLDIGTVQFRTDPRSPWKDHPCFTADWQEWFREELRLRLLPEVHKIEAEIRDATLATESLEARCKRIISENSISEHLRREHRADCALYPDNDFGSTNHCTCRGDEARYGRTA